MISFFTILLLQFAFTYKLPFMPKSFRFYCQDEKKMGDNRILKTNNVTNVDILKFIENIKKSNETQLIDIDSWDDGEVEW